MIFSKICVNSGFDNVTDILMLYLAANEMQYQILEEFSNNFCTKEKTARDEL